jgi:hypothetical protein
MGSKYAGSIALLKVKKHPSPVEAKMPIDIASFLFYTGRYQWRLNKFPAARTLQEIWKSDSLNPLYCISGNSILGKSSMRENERQGLS